MRRQGCCVYIFFYTFIFTHRHTETDKQTDTHTTTNCSAFKKKPNKKTKTNLESCDRNFIFANNFIITNSGQRIVTQSSVLNRSL